SAHQRSGKPRFQGRIQMTFIQTTHVGSLPRSAELAAMLLQRDHHEAVSETAFDALVGAEIARAVRAQVDAGVSIVSDGELGKVGQSVRGFMNAPSPGLVTAFQPNQFYPTHEAYLADLVDAMRPEYEAIVAAGFDLQLDARDLAMAAHTGFQSLSEGEFLARAA